MQLKKVVIHVLLFVSFLPAIAQSRERREAKADSLWNVLQTQSLTDKQKAGIYEKLSDIYSYFDAEKTISCLLQSLQLSRKENMEEKIPHITRSLGVYYGMTNRFDTAKIYLDQSLASSVKIKDRREEVLTYRCIAYWHYRQNNYVQTLDNCMKVLKVSEAINDTMSRYNALTNIASLYRELGNFDRAFYYVQKSKELCRECKMPRTDMADYELSLIYMEQGKLDSALVYALKSVDAFRGAYQTFEIYSMQAVAKIYTLKQSYPKALEYADESVRLARGFSDKRLETIGKQILSTIYREQKRYEKCETTASEAWNTGSTMLDTGPELAYNIAYSNLQLGNREKATLFLHKFAHFVKEHNVKGFHQTMADMEIRYETEKKEMRIAALEAQRKLYTGLGVLGLAAILLSYGVLYYRHRLNKQKRRFAAQQAEQQIKQLEQEKQLVATLAALEGENAERSRLSRDLHDGLGSMLSVIKLNLRNIKNVPLMGKDDTERYENAMTLLDRFIVELRRVAHNMMPESLMRYGIKASLEDFCRSIPEAEFQFFGENPKLDNRLEILIYRCAYELINNAVRHAAATRIDVQLTVDEKLVSLTVRDNGVGFDPQTVQYGAGFNNMRNRISAYNGKINICSLPGSGAEINIEIELP